MPKFFNKPTPKPTPRRRLSDVPKNSPAQAAGNLKQDTAPQPSFRRNRTLTGSTSAQLKSANELSSELRSPRAAAHHLRSKQRSLGMMLFTVLLVAGSLVFLVYQFTSEVRVSIYGQVSPLTNAQSTRLTESVQSYYQTRPLERLRFMLNEDQLAAYMQTNSIREVASVSNVINDGIGKTAIELKVREPLAEWTIGSERRYVDQSGIVFTMNYFDPPTVTIRDDSGITSSGEEDARAVTSERFLRFIGQAVGALRSQDVPVVSVSIPPSSSRQVEIITESDIRLKMTVDRPAGEQAEDAANAYMHIDDKDLNVKMVDIRVSGVAYYR